MKKKFLSLVLVFVSVAVFAQVPYFSGTVGKNKLYGYTSLKVRPGINAQETYTTFQYGTSTYTAAGLDLYTGVGCNYLGVLFRTGYKFNQWFGIGGQITPSFDLSNSMKFSYLTTALYMNGAITKDGKLFWCSNTWWGVNRDAPFTLTNWEYLGYSFSFKNGHSITPMVGAIHSWKFDQDVDIAAGFYYTIKNWDFYLWGNDFLKDHPRVVAGIDFTF